MSHTPGPWVIDEDGRVMNETELVVIEGYAHNVVTWLLETKKPWDDGDENELQYSELVLKLVNEYRALHAAVMRYEARRKGELFGDR